VCPGAAQKLIAEAFPIRPNEGSDYRFGTTIALWGFNRFLFEINNSPSKTDHQGAGFRIRTGNLIAPIMPCAQRFVQLALSEAMTTLALAGSNSKFIQMRGGPSRYFGLRERVARFHRRGVLFGLREARGPRPGDGATENGYDGFAAL